MATVKTLIGNIKGPKGDTGAKGATGATGAQGPTGPQGATGAAGATGATGTRGSRWSSGTAITGTSSTATVFSSTGITDALVNDMYLNTSTGNTYRCTVAGNASTAKWVYTGNIKGAKGDTGATGSQGPLGATGPTGATGPAGEKGATGATGQRGSRWSEGTAITGTSTTATIFSGTGIADALVNDHYMNTSTGNVYRCTTAGNASTAKWVYVGNIRGPQGPKGDTGATGATGATGPQGPKGEKGEPGETPALISTYADMMASTVSGYLPDALAVKEGFNTVNSNLSKVKSDIIKCSNNVTSEYASMETNCLLNDTLYVGVGNYKGKIFLCVGTYSGHTNASTGCSVNLILFGSDGNYTIINLLNNGTDYPVYSFTTNGIVYVKRSGGTASSTVYTRLIPIN